MMIDCLECLARKWGLALVAGGGVLAATAAWAGERPAVRETKPAHAYTIHWNDEQSAAAQLREVQANRQRQTRRPLVVHFAHSRPAENETAAKSVETHEPQETRQPAAQQPLSNPPPSSPDDSSFANSPAANSSFANSSFANSSAAWDQAETTAALGGASSGWRAVPSPPATSVPAPEWAGDDSSPWPMEDSNRSQAAASFLYAHRSPASDELAPGAAGGGHRFRRGGFASTQDPADWATDSDGAAHDRPTAPANEPEPKHESPAVPTLQDDLTTRPDVTTRPEVQQLQDPAGGLGRPTTPEQWAGDQHHSVRPVVEATPQPWSFFVQMLATSAGVLLAVPVVVLGLAVWLRTSRGRAAALLRVELVRPPRASVPGPHYNVAPPIPPPELPNRLPPLEPEPEDTAILQRIFEQNLQMREQLKTNNSP